MDITVLYDSILQHILYKNCRPRVSCAAQSKELLGGAHANKPAVQFLFWLAYMILTINLV